MNIYLQQQKENESGIEKIGGFIGFGAKNLAKGIGFIGGNLGKGLVNTIDSI